MEEKKIMCDRCLNDFDEGEMTEIDGGQYCPECSWEAFTKCDMCGELVPTEEIAVIDGEMYCLDCYDDKKVEERTLTFEEVNLIRGIAFNVMNANKAVSVSFHCYSGFILFECTQGEEGTSYWTRKFEKTELEQAFSMSLEHVDRAPHITDEYDTLVDIFHRCAVEKTGILSIKKVDNFDGCIYSFYYGSQSIYGTEAKRFRNEVIELMKGIWGLE